MHKPYGAPLLYMTYAAVSLCTQNPNMSANESPTVFAYRFITPF